MRCFYVFLVGTVGIYLPATHSKNTINKQQNQNSITPQLYHRFFVFLC